jgi:hypothetical protein
MTQNTAVEKVLRVGVIYNGKIIDEQVFRKPETIYIGDTSKAHFVVPSSALPSRFPIFYFKSGKYELVIMENMSGKVFLKGKVVDIEEVIKKGMLKKRGNAYILPLSTDARGKVVVGSAIVLFQFITPPPKPPKLRLPRSIRGSWTQMVDWPLTSILGTVFTIGYAILFWMLGLPTPEPKTFDQLDNRFAKMIAPEVEKVDEKPTEEKKVEEGEGPATAKKEETAEAVEAPKKKKGPRDAATRAQEEEMRVAEMKKKVAGVGLLKLIGSAGADGSAGIISDVMGEGGKDRDIDSALSGVKQIGIATDAGQRSRKGDAGATETAKIDDLKVANTSGNVKVSGMKEKEVTGSTKIGAPEVEGSLDQAGITKVVKQNSAAIQRCYEKALKTNPQLKGKVAVTWMINQDGRAEMVEISEDTMKDAGVSSCIKGVVSRWRFQKPEAPASVTFPFVFSPAN